MRKRSDFVSKHEFLLVFVVLFMLVVGFSLFISDSDVKFARITGMPVRDDSPDYKVLYFHQDNLGSTVAKTDSDGAVVWSADYAPFGQPFNEVSEDGQNKYKYNAKELDANTGLYYYGARYYDPDTGRFTNADTVKGSITDPQSLNRYTYVKNNPMKYIDPSGNEFKSTVSLEEDKTKYYAEQRQYFESNVAPLLRNVLNSGDIDFAEGWGTENIISVISRSLGKGHVLLLDTPLYADAKNRVTGVANPRGISLAKIGEGMMVASSPFMGDHFIVVATEASDSTKLSDADFASVLLHEFVHISDYKRNPELSSFETEYNAYRASASAVKHIGARDRYGIDSASVRSIHDFNDATRNEPVYGGTHGGDWRPNFDVSDPTPEARRLLGQFMTPVSMPSEKPVVGW